jgi:hypothetical protein
MPARHRGRRAALRSHLRRALRGGAATIQRTWRAFRRRREVRVEVLLTDRARGRAIQREVCDGLRRLRRVLGSALPSEMAVVVQQVVRAERPLAGCCEVADRPDRGRFVVVRLALSVDGRRLGTDEVLAALADQCIALAKVRPARTAAARERFEPLAEPYDARSHK